MPNAAIMAGDFQRQAAADAIRNRDFERALNLATKTVEANPNSLRDRLWLVQILIASNRPNDAEAELRKAVDLDRSDPERWIALVQFLTQSKKLEEAEKEIRAAETAIRDRIPQGLLGLARCCEVVGLTYRASGRDDKKAKTWYDAATLWFRTAQNARPNDQDVTRRFIEFLVRSSQLADAETQLTAILERQGANGKNTDEIAWARRTLALTLLLSNDYEKVRKALVLIEPIAQSLEPQQADRRKPEDLRVLARVYEAQKTPEYQKKAREVLEQMLATNWGNVEDRFLLALMCSRDGDWPKARDQYRAVLAQSESSKDLEVVIKRPVYITQFVTDLIKRSQSDQDHEGLSEAHELLDKLRTIRPDSFIVVDLEARLFNAQNQLEKAIDLIRSTAARPNLPDPVQLSLARLAEELRLYPLAEELLRTLVTRVDSAPNRLALASFLGHRGQVKEALDFCEPLWKDAANTEILTQSTLDILFSSGSKNDRLQVDRVADWFQKALERKPNSSILRIGLANLRERQGQFQEAEALYRQDIDQGEGNMISLNNLAWLTTLRNGKGSVALDLINRAIARRGPLPELLDTRGVIYAMSGDGQHAIEDLEKVCNLNPSGPKFFHLAQAYLQANNKDAALQALTKARALGLKPEDLHPLEVAAYQQVLDRFGAH